VPVCGGGDVTALEALRTTPVWCVHGEQDDSVSVEESRRMVAELRRLHLPHRFDQLPGWGHESWEWLYDADRTEDSLVDWCLQFRKEHAAPDVRIPKRKGGFKDLFQERVVVSYPASSPIPGETEMLRAEAERVARYTFGDFVMRSGRFIVRADQDISPLELEECNHLMLGRNDNHSLLAKVDRKLLARHVRGSLKLRGDSFIGKSLVAATCQTSPWNRQKLLGVVTYQNYQQVRGMSDRLCGPAAAPLAVNLFDTQRRRFILQEG
jgi:hypothetical protein